MEALSGFYNRRGRNVALSLGLVVSGGYLAVQYARTRFTELQQRNLEEKATVDHIQRRFKQTQDDCNFTIEALLPSVQEQLMDKLNVEELTQSLQTISRAAKTEQKPILVPQVQVEGSEITDTNSQPQPQEANGDGVAQEPTMSNGVAPVPAAEPSEPVDKVVAPTKSKSELWNDIKLMSFTRAISAVYITALVALQAHVQLHLLARYNYVGSIADLAMTDADHYKGRSPFNANGHLSDFDEAWTKHQPRGISQQTELRFLTFSWWLLHRGWPQIVDAVQQAVAEVFGRVPLKTELTPHELSRLLYKTRVLVEARSDSRKNLFASALMPQSSADELDVLRQGGMPESSMVIDTELRKLLDENLDIFEAEDFAVVLSACVDQLFKRFLANVDPCFKESPNAVQQPTDDTFQHPLARFTELNDRSARLVNLLPSVTQEAGIILSTSPNIYLESLSDVKELADFSAIVFAPSKNVLLQSRNGFNTV